MPQGKGFGSSHFAGCVLTSPLFKFTFSDENKPGDFLTLGGGTGLQRSLIRRQIFRRRTGYLDLTRVSSVQRAKRTFYKNGENRRVLRPVKIACEYKKQVWDATSTRVTGGGEDNVDTCM